MNDPKPCPFCGSKKIIVDSPYVELKESGKYEPATKYCCQAQRKNQSYKEKHYHPMFSDKPKNEEVSEW